MLEKGMYVRCPIGQEEDAREFVYGQIKDHFDRTFWLGLANRHIALWDKAKMIYVKSKLFRWRKRHLIP